MASAVYSEPPASRLSIALEGEASASPFPSPSSSFLPPPTPGAHEFAVKPASNTRIGRKLSATAHTATNANSNVNTNLNGDTKKNEHTPLANGYLQPPIDVSISTEQATEIDEEKKNGLSDEKTAIASGQLLPPANISISATEKERATDLAPPPLSPALVSPTTPTPYKSHYQAQHNLAPPHSPGADQSTSSATTPTILTSALPPEDAPSHKFNIEDEPPLARINIPSSLEAGLSGVASSPNSPAFSTFSSASASGRARPLSVTGSPSSSRPAPPSPALSRRVSGVPSSGGARSRLSGTVPGSGSRPPSQVISRAGSLRKPKTSSARASPVLAPHRLSQSFAPPLPVSPHALTFALSGPESTSRPASVASASGLAAATTPTALLSQALPAVYIKVRDFGFPASDARHVGLGPDVPRANEVGRLNKRLARRSLSGSDSGDSVDGDGEEEYAEGDGDVDGDSYSGFGGWNSQLLGRLSWVGAAAAAASVSAAGEGEGEGDRPSQSVLEMNFEQEEEEAEEEEEEPLYPGIYRALFTFEPEGTAEMRLDEDQLVRVVGRGGGVGWAIVVDESAVLSEEEKEDAVARGETVAVRHALVPEGYLEPVKLDWEEEEGADHEPTEGEENAGVRVAV